MQIQFTRIDHIQICVPRSKEPIAHVFYTDVLGLREIEKPTHLKPNGGFWLEIAGIQLHIGVEDEIHPSKRHPAFEVENLEQVRDYLVNQGIRIKEDKPIPGFNRFSFYDPFGNRIELLGRAD